MSGDKSTPHMRPMKCELGQLTRPDGSATLFQGDTCVMTAVYGPGEVRMNKELIDRATVDVTIAIVHRQGDLGGSTARDRRQRSGNLSHQGVRVTVVRNGRIPGVVGHGGLAVVIKHQGNRNRTADHRINRILHFIETNLTRPLLVSELAREAGVSEPQFRRIFRDAMALGPKEYLLRERMNYARRILESEALRVGEVAELLQFETVYQSSNQYKRIHRHSPVQDSHC